MDLSSCLVSGLALKETSLFFYCSGDSYSLFIPVPGWLARRSNHKTHMQSIHLGSRVMSDMKFKNR
jgi:hypothetical protein